jgi:hypothetical protein
MIITGGGLGRLLEVRVDRLVGCGSGGVGLA